jgi:hypothetical protein
MKIEKVSFEWDADFQAFSISDKKIHHVSLPLMVFSSKDSEKYIALEKWPERMAMLGSISGGSRK